MVALKQPLQALVVDDDRGVAGAVSSVVEGLGHDAFAAGNRREALEIVQARLIHFSILDVHVQADDGLHILGSLRQISDRLPAIFISGALTPEITARAMQLGVLSVLEKPLDVRALREAIRALIATERLG